MSIQNQDDFPVVQAHIYRLALSLDSLVVNGVQFGAISSAFPGMVRRQADTLLADLETLEQDRPLVAVAKQQRANEALAAVRTEIGRMIDLITRLIAFRSLSLLEVHHAVSQIAILRDQCVALIEELERCFATPKPFYETRPTTSAEALNCFIADLDRLLEDAWHVAKSAAPVSST